MNIDIGTTLRDAQNEIVMSLLPRQHEVKVEGIHHGAGRLQPLTRPLCCFTLGHHLQCPKRPA